jgi:hypothetical protein
MPVFSTDAAAAGVRAELQAELDSLTTSDANQDTALAALITNDEAQDTAIAGVQAELVTKADAAALATVSTTGQYSALLGIPSTFAPAAHDQAWSTILGTPTTLAGYGIADAASAAQGALAATAVQPAAISSFETSAQLNTRDTANRARANHTGTQAASSISDFAATAAAAAPVQSVAGRNGAVTLAKGDVGLGAVDNTADAAKPISTATQAALNLKVNPYTESAETTFTNNATILIAHGLGVVPKDWHVVYRCKTAEAGYSVGDEINTDTWFWSLENTYNAQAAVDATNVVLTVSLNPHVINKTTRLVFQQTPANWRVVARWR